MTVRTSFILTAIVAIISALGFLIAPGHLARIYGVQTTPAVQLGYRYFGVALLSLGLIFWLAKDSQDMGAMMALLMGAAVGDAAGVFVSIWGATAGIMNRLGWSVVLIYTVLLAGCVYFLRPLAKASSHAT
jgi:hypothetical protein